MAGPKAPKDPERKRPYFYIMKDKDIYGSVQEDGSIIPVSYTHLTLPTILRV